MSHYEKYMNYIGKSITNLRGGSKGFYEEVNAYGFAEPHFYFKAIGLWLHAYINVCEVDCIKQGYIAEFCLDVVPNDNVNKVKSCIMQVVCKGFKRIDLYNYLYDNMPEIECLLWQEKFWRDSKRKEKRKNRG